jgi:hypothetical protein
MSTKKSTIRKPTQEEIEAAERQEREIFYLQSKMGLTIAREVAAVVFPSALLEANLILGVYDILKADDDGEYLEAAKQTKLIDELKDAAVVAKEVLKLEVSEPSPATVLEFYTRLYGAFDMSIDD